MNRTKKTALCVMGSMAALGVIAYCMLPRDEKHALKHMVTSMASKGSCGNSSCPCMR